MSKHAHAVRTLDAASDTPLINPPEFQVNPAAAGAVEPERLDRSVDSTAARGDVNPGRTPEEEGSLTISNGTAAGLRPASSAPEPVEPQPSEGATAPKPVEKGTAPAPAKATAAAKSKDD